MARVLVTGGMGFVGSHLLVRLVSRGDEVRVADVVEPESQPRVSSVLRGLDFEFRMTDVRDPAAVAALLDGVDYVFHLASHVGIDHYLRDPVEVADVIVAGSRTVAVAAAAAGTPMVFVSTSEVFGRNPKVPWAENADCVMGDPSRPRWVYAAAKIVAEHILFGLARQRGLKFSTVRLFNLYGPGQECTFFISRTLWRLAHGLPPVVFDSGGQRRCFTWVEDAVEALLLAAESSAARWEAFNIGSDTPLTVLEAIEVLAHCTGLDPARLRLRHRRWEEVYGAGYDEPVVRIPDISKARRLLGWRPSTGLAEGAERMLEWAAVHGWWTEDRNDTD